MPTLDFEGRQLEAHDDETVLDLLLRHGQDIPHGCRVGSCQSCLLRSPSALTGGSVQGLDDSVVEAGGFLACVAKAKDVPQATTFDPEFFPSFAGILVDKTPLSSDVLLLRFDVPDLRPCPGRFVQVTSPDGVRRPYSVATSALEDSPNLDLHVRIIPGGAMSRAVTRAEAGHTFSFQGPFGKCSYRPGRESSPVVLVGSGTGLAPLYAVATDAVAKGHVGPIHLFFGSTKPDGLYFLDQLRSLERSYSQISLTLCVDQDPAAGMVVGSPIEQALHHFPEMDEATVYACGHPALVKAAQRQCFLAGASMKRIFVDAFVPAGRS